VRAAEQARGAAGVLREWVSGTQHCGLQCMYQRLSPSAYAVCIVDRDLHVGIYIVIMVIQLFMIMRPVSGASVVFKVARQELQHSF